MAALAALIVGVGVVLVLLGVPVFIARNMR